MAAITGNLYSLSWSCRPSDSRMLNVVGRQLAKAMGDGYDYTILANTAFIHESLEHAFPSFRFCKDVLADAQITMHYGHDCCRHCKCTWTTEQVTATYPVLKAVEVANGVADFGGNRRCSLASPQFGLHLRDYAKSVSYHSASAEITAVYRLR